MGEVIRKYQGAEAWEEEELTEGDTKRQQRKTLMSTWAPRADGEEGAAAAPTLGLASSPAALVECGRPAIECCTMADGCVVGMRGTSPLRSWPRPREANDTRRANRLIRADTDTKEGITMQRPPGARVWVAPFLI
ncbi:hypothetical protein GGTG_06527 [Gaeumannomyces tritici R3-111a-1]|uniref:Uncharacterized protein n=1 Tax=Gaeumannomyces tritici (strain R3-111a-1) TaxID=644352 RepID=J3NZ27_GAET3|nr:hypothetical protein GGTG_06527 [Gaeumannomyces tritici R3-111a-1]EJT76610.1 hypothetical protein GGTG_06527 [Gaeumannomyces tritici R3-111a-1]